MPARERERREGSIKRTKDMKKNKTKAGLGTRRTLIFPVATLDLLVDVLLHLALEDARAGGLVKAGSLEDMCRIDPVILATAHDMFFQVGAELVLIDRDLQATEQAIVSAGLHAKATRM